MVFKIGANALACFLNIHGIWSSPSPLLNMLRYLCCLLVTAVSFVSLPADDADSHALLIVGIAGHPEIRAEHELEKEAWVEVLRANGYKKDRIHIIDSNDYKRSSGESSPREQTLEYFSRLEKDAEKLDLLMVLIGRSTTRADHYRFEVKGPRLERSDFVDAFEGLPLERLSLFLTGPGGYGLANAVRGQDRLIVSATSNADEINRTRFGFYLARSFKEEPHRPLLAHLQNVEEKVSHYYDERSRARPEHATLWVEGADPIEAPFTMDSVSEGQEIAASKRALLQQLQHRRIGEAIAAPDSRQPAHITDKLDEADEPSYLPPQPETLEDLIDLPQPWEFVTEEGDILPYVSLRESSDQEKQTLSQAPSKEQYPDDAGVILQRKEKIVFTNRYATKRQTQYDMRIFSSSARALLDRHLSGGRLNHLKIIRPDGVTVEIDPVKWHAYATQSQYQLSVPGVIPGSLVFLEYEHSTSEPELMAYGEHFYLLKSVPTEHLELTILHPQAIQLFNQVYGGYDPELKENTNEQGIEKTWVFRDLPPEWSTEYATPETLVSWPRVAISSYEKWDDFVQWYRRLYRGADATSKSIQALASDIMEDADTREERIREAYDYVSKMRYVAIEVGAHKWRPRDADIVLLRQYGDCKDKGNLLISLLREMDIQAQFALVARQMPFDPDFPSHLFNHALVYVPEGLRGSGQPLWMDTTDEAAPFGVMPPGDPGQFALILEENAHRIEQIPPFAYGEQKTTQEDLTIRAEEGVMKTTYAYRPSGYEAYRWWSLIRHQGMRQTKQIWVEKLLRNWPEAALEKGSVDIHVPESYSGELVLHATLVSDLPEANAPNAMALSLPPPLLDWSGDMPVEQAGRMPVTFHKGYPIQYRRKVRIGEGIQMEPISFSSSMQGASAGVSLVNHGDTQSLQAEFTVSKTRFDAPEPLRQLRNMHARWRTAAAASPHSAILQTNPKHDE